MPSSRVIDAACLAFAGWTMLVHAVGALGGGSWTLVWAAALAGAGALARALRRGVPAPDAPDGSERALWALVVLAVAVTMLAHRPDGDDAVYLSIASGVADFPARPLLRFDATYGLPGLPILFAPYRIHSVEALYGAISLLSGMSAIAAAHLVCAPLWASLVPLAYARLLAGFGGRRTLGVATAMAFLLMDGNGHGGWGNTSFVRLFQGKALFLSVFAPLILAYARAFSVNPTRRNWVLLAAALLASVGASSTAVWVGPLLAGAALAASWRPERAATRTALLGLSAAAYPALAGLLLRAMIGGAIASPALPPGRESALLQETLRYVLGGAPHAAACLALSAGAAFLQREQGARRLGAVLAILLLALFNPWTAPAAALHLTAPSAFFRVFWLIPFPLAAGLAAMRACDRAERPGARALCAALLAAALLSGRSTLSAADFTVLKAPGLKVPQEYPLVLALNAAVPPGSLVLAPAEVSLWMVTQNHHPYPLLVKYTSYDSINRRLPPEELQRRRRLMAHVGGPAPAPTTPADLARGLEELSLSGVCLDLRLPWNEETRPVLRRAGFRPGPLVPGYEIWARP
ncbi:MAG: hypothetical protein HY928_09935 [Elusimicrobia bacterium]|nr:hypothetical protein [Elusimicrobiota bacterium]